MHVRLALKRDDMWVAGLRSLVGQVAEVTDVDGEADVVVRDESPFGEEKDERVLLIGDDIMSFRALRERHVGGLVPPDATVEEFFVGLRAVAAGKTHIHSDLTIKFLLFERHERTLVSLTPREEDVLRLIARGYTNRETARKLKISVRTVESHRANMREKLFLKTRQELTKFAAEHGYLE